MFTSMGTSRVESELVEMAGHLAAGTCRFLQLLAEFDERAGWAGPGLRTCAQWLNWRVGLSLRTARDHLRVAHALRRLPATTAAFAAGRVSYSKVRALTRFATPATEEGLLSVALHGTTSQLEGLVAAALFILVFAWNDFVVAVTMTSSQEVRTFPVAIYFYLGFYGREWGPLLAASLVSIVPIIAVFVFLQRYFMSGLTGGGVKG